MIKNIGFVLCAFLVSGGCSIRPVTQDVAGPAFDSYGIVWHVRCEMRDAIITYVLRSIARHEGEAVAEQIRNTKDGLLKLYAKRKTLSPVMQQLIAKYGASTITYDFTFDITENNNLSANVGLGQTLTRGTFNLALSGEADRQRENTRTFRISDNFLGLVLKGDDFCSEQDTRTAHYIYPITGSLNLAEMVGNFLDLNQSGNLTAKTDDGQPSTSDNIQFVTQLTGTINPTLVITPLTSTLDLAGAGLNGTSTRQDKHSVIIVLTLPAEKPTGPVASHATIAAEHVVRQREIQTTSDLQNIARALRNRGF